MTFLLFRHGRRGMVYSLGNERFFDEILVCLFAKPGLNSGIVSRISENARLGILANLFGQGFESYFLQ